MEECLGKVENVRDINLGDYKLSSFTLLKQPGPSLEVIFLDEAQETNKPAEETNDQWGGGKLIYPFAKDGYKPTQLSVKQANVLVKADPTVNVKEIIEIVIDSSNLATLDYSPGHTIAVFPRNTDKEVFFLLETLELLDKANQSCRVQNKLNGSKKNLKLSHIPDRTTPNKLLRDILFIHAVPKKQFLRALANCCSSKEEETFLNGIASKEGSNYYNELFLEKGLTLLDLLKVCNSCKPSLALLIEHLPRVLPRPYSIANSPITHANELKIIFSILNERPGITTSMMASMAKDIINGIAVRPPTVIAYPRQPNKFCYTAEDFHQNQILIAIGTGVAPFLGFLEHKAHLMRNSTKQPGSTWLFVGAAQPSAIPHRAKILELCEKHDRRVVERYFESFSRVPDAAFHYVQDQFYAHSEELVKFLLDSETILYVCAGARVSQAIESALSVCLERERNLTKDECKELFKDLRYTGKYREDLWT